MTRLAVLGLAYEGNTFAPSRLDLEQVRDVGLMHGPEIADQHAGGTSTLSGYLRAEAWPGVEVVPLVAGMLAAGGPLTYEAFEACADELTASLRAHGPFDGVLVDLHGAATADGILDVDGELLRRFRLVVGPNVPIGASLDLHANVSVQMIEHATVLNAYRTNPHVDADEVAEEVVRLVLRAARGEVTPTMAFLPVPAVINILCQHTDTPPMNDLLADAARIQSLPGVLSATIVQGYPYADVPEMGMSVIVITDDDAGSARQHARELADLVWARRHEFSRQATPVEDAIGLAQLEPSPVLLLDVGDNIGGGSPGDSVVLLAAARRLPLPSLVCIIADPAAVTTCHKAGVGTKVHLLIGGAQDPMTGPPVEATATVIGLHDGRYQASGAVHAGIRHFDVGPSAAVQLDTGQTVILTSRPALPFSIDQLTVFGLKPEDFQAIVAKGVQSPLAGYSPHVARIIQVDTPGCTSADLHRFTYRHRRRPLHPFEDGFDLP